jgi:hypothetical protein
MKTNFGSGNRGVEGDESAIREVFSQAVALEFAKQRARRR